MKLFKDLYNYRELLKSNVKKEIRGKYKGSILGVLWSFINPLLMTLVYAIVFPFLMSNTGEPNYYVYLIVGIIPWNFFTTVINQGSLCIRTEASIIKKVYFPRAILPISVALSGLVNFFISSIIILLFVLGSGTGLSWHLIFLPLIAIIQTLFSLGLVFILSSVNVYIKDLEYIVNFIMMMAFYGTPILYNVSRFASSPELTTLIKLNPMTAIINGYRDIFYYHQMPDFVSLGVVGIGSLILVIVGYAIFKKLEKGFAEEV
ncbi:MAG: ABC transporter permease [Bacilli bacterium]